MSQLQGIEQKLLTYDPTFTVYHTHASITSQRSALMSAFRPSYDDGDVEGVPFVLQEDVCHDADLLSLTGNTRIHLNTERWRVSEAYLSPSMAGVDSAGLGEVIQNLIPYFIESRSKRTALDFVEDRKEVIQVRANLSLRKN